MATQPMTQQEIGRMGGIARGVREQFDRDQKPVKAARICKLVAMDARDGGLTVDAAMKSLRQLGYFHKEAAGMVLEAMGFSVKKEKA